MRHERFEGVDCTVLREDVWADEPARTACPKCALALPVGAVRCPRCNALVLTGCCGSCASCGSRGCSGTPRG